MDFFVAGGAYLLNGSSDSRPAITDVFSVEDVERWYWTRSELVHIGRRIGVRTTGTKMELLDRIISTLSGASKPRSDCVSRKSSKAKLEPPFGVHMCIPAGQPFNRELRSWIEAQTGASVRVNQEMRDLMKDPQGRTLGDLLEMVSAIDPVGGNKSRKAIGEQFELNRFMREMSKRQPELDRDQRKAAWERFRELPAERRAAYLGGSVLGARE